MRKVLIALALVIGSAAYAQDLRVNNIDVRSQGTATSGVTGFDSYHITLHGSAWNGSVALDDCWEINVNDFSSAFANGSNLVFNHQCNISNGSGRILIGSDFVVDGPRAATPSLYSNSFAWDNQGHYYESGDQVMLWEMANSVNCNGCALNTLIFRQNYVPLFGSTCTGCQAEVAFGGSGVNQVAGNYSGPPKWLWTNLRSSTFHTVKFEQAVSADRTVTAVDADSNTIRPLSAPGSDHKWVQYVDNTGLQNRTQPAAADITPAGSTGQIQFNSGGTAIGADSNLFWDNTNKRLGVGQSSPGVSFHIKTTASGAYPQAEIENGASGGGTLFYGLTDTGNGAGGNKFELGSSTSSTTALVTLDLANSNVGINQTSPAKTLDVNGSVNIARSIYTGLNTVSFSATPNFDLNQGSTQTITLTNNVTSSTISNAAAGQMVTFIICQDSTGGRTFVWPTAFKGTMTVGGTLSTCSAQTFVAKDTTHYYATGAGVTNQ